MEKLSVLVIMRVDFGYAKSTNQRPTWKPTSSRRRAHHWLSRSAQRACKAGDFTHVTLKHSREQPKAIKNRRMTYKLLRGLFIRHYTEAVDYDSVLWRETHCVSAEIHVGTRYAPTTTVRWMEWKSSNTQVQDMCLTHYGRRLCAITTLVSWVWTGPSLMYI